MRRRIAVIGDTLSSGGTVLPHDGPQVTMYGHRVALIGGPAFCSACKETGRIAKSGGPYRISTMGEAALDGDIVLCKCARPPQILAMLSGESWCDDMVEEQGSVVSSLTATGGVTSVKKGAFDEQVKATEYKAEGLPYYIETEDGRVSFGRLDASGILPRIYTGDEPGTYTVYWGDDALAKHYGE
ncbi:PAAR domain-containing protein (plasmid) [Robbsia andropogonis]|uniref:PAAR domain-containing protein n=1 Tax=Robbsia andropogonis TaxID=28092 RepID=UPI003D1D865A